MHQNRFPGRSLCYIDSIAFLAVGVVALAVVVAVAADYHSSIQDNHAVLLCLRLMVSFCLIFR
jgi:hypothetical protein